MQENKSLNPKLQTDPAAEKLAAEKLKELPTKHWPTGLTKLGFSFGNTLKVWIIVSEQKPFGFVIKVTVYVPESGKLKIGFWALDVSADEPMTPKSHKYEVALELKSLKWMM